MGVWYGLAYRVGFAPWERAGLAAGEHFARLLDREERDRSRPLGRALDLGCGRGGHTVELAERGWQATGVDGVARALDVARRRPGADAARFVHADVSALTEAGLDGPFDLFLGIGCFHGLSDDHRRRYGEDVSALASPGSTLLMMAFSPGRRVAVPRGVSEESLLAALPGWTLEDTQPADTSGMPGPLRRVAPRWLRLRRT